MNMARINGDRISAWRFPDGIVSVEDMTREQLLEVLQHLAVENADLQRRVAPYTLQKLRETGSLI